MVPIKFLRQFRIFGYAIFDFIAVFLGFYILAPALSYIFRKIRIDIPKKNWLFLALPIGIVVHLLHGQMTPMTKDFINLQSHYLLKTVIIILLILGLRGIKLIKKNLNK